jgi:hypothetical protein
MLKKARRLTHQTLARRDAPFFSQARPQRVKRRGGTARTSCGRSPLDRSWRTENTLQYFRASERRENAAGELFQHPVRFPALAPHGTEIAGSAS